MKFQAILSTIGLVQYGLKIEKFFEIVTKGFTVPRIFRMKIKKFLFWYCFPQRKQSHDLKSKKNVEFEAKICVLGFRST